jgi:hypothetical protein
MSGYIGQLATAVIRRQRITRQLHERNLPVIAHSSTSETKGDQK